MGLTHGFEEGSVSGQDPRSEPIGSQVTGKAVPKSTGLRPGADLGKYGLSGRRTDGGAKAADFWCQVTVTPAWDPARQVASSSEA